MSVFTLFLVGCHDGPKSSWAFQEIKGRDEEKPLYRVSVCPDWMKKTTQGSLQNTMLPLCEYVYDDIRITIHNFPSEEWSARIPPQAQIARWKKQFSTMDPGSSMITPQAYSGYVGLKFEGEGMIDGHKQKMMGWSLQLAPEHYPHCDPHTRADVTIKVVGPADQVLAHQEEIERFARSFELIEGLSMK